MDYTNQLSHTLEGSRRTMGWPCTCTSNSCILEGSDDGECAGVDRCRTTITFSPCIYLAFHGIPVVLIKCARYIFMSVPQKKAEPVPNLKAALRLLCHIFSTATDIPEFQRQLATPNVPKFSIAVLTLADKHHDRELQVSCFPIVFPFHCVEFLTMGTLKDIVHQYPHPHHPPLPDLAPRPAHPTLRILPTLTQRRCSNTYRLETPRSLLASVCRPSCHGRKSRCGCFVA